MSARPSIVFVTTDTQGRNMVSAYGRRPGVETPNIDRLAEQAVLFDSAFCASPVCTPARSAWYSGLHPNRNGAWTNGLAMARNVPLAAELLSEAGYRCVHLGKWHLCGEFRPVSVFSMTQMRRCSGSKAHRFRPSQARALRLKGLSPQSSRSPQMLVRTTNGDQWPTAHISSPCAQR